MDRGGDFQPQTGAPPGLSDAAEDFSATLALVPRTMELFFCAIWVMTMVVAMMGVYPFPSTIVVQTETSKARCASSGVPRHGASMTATHLLGWCFDDPLLMLMFQLRQVAVAAGPRCYRALLPCQVLMVQL